jgi:hypothetical protein
MNQAIRAHYDGKFIVPDEPMDLPSNQPLTVWVQQIPQPAGMANVPTKWTPLNIRIDEKLSRAIAEDPEFNIEES